MERLHDAPERGAGMWSLAGGLLLVILLGTTVYALVGMARERRHADDLSKSNQALNASVQQMQAALQSVSQRLDASIAQQSAARADAPVARRKPRLVTETRRVTSANRAERRRPDDPRWQQIQAKLADQDQQIASTRQDVAKTRQDLTDQLHSTHDELNGAIATNHDQLVVLQKRGERNYYEFDVNKSKQFQHIGPLGLSLRKANTKHQYCDLSLMVDDQQLDKKHVNLDEPVTFRPSDRSEAVEIVVNQISKNEIKGYISEPKYKRSELAASAASTPAGTAAATAAGTASSSASDPAATGTDSSAKQLQQR